MNKHIHRIGLALFMYASALFLYHSAQRRRLPPPGPQTLDPTLFRAVNWFPGHGLTAEEKRTYLQGIERRVQKLSQMETEREKRAQASRLTRSAREQARREVQSVWALVVKTNMTKFYELRELARQDPHGETPCTICDGYSYMPCIMCQGHNGKCSLCGGTGRRNIYDYCPACVGSGQCYLCTGSGKMFCPFCDDGMILIDWPFPESAPPLE